MKAASVGFWLCVMVLISLAGCQLSLDLVYETPPVPPLDALSTAEFTPTVEPIATHTPLPPTTIPCIYAWGYKNLPDETARMQDLLAANNLGGVEAVLTSYGETCIEPVTNIVIDFLPLQTDMSFSVPLQDAENRSEAGRITRQILNLIRTIPAAEGANHPGRIELLFGDGRVEKRVQFQYSLELAEKVRASGDEQILALLEGNP